MATGHLERLKALSARGELVAKLDPKRIARAQRYSRAAPSRRMIRIAISQAAFDAIARTMPFGSVNFEAGVDDKGERGLSRELGFGRRKVGRDLA